MNFNTASLKTCQRCGEEFAPRRSDAKYCSAKCKNAKNNDRYREATSAYEAIVGETHAILWKNREILLKFLDKTVNVTTLKELGFNPNNITEYREPEKGRTEFLFKASKIQ